MPPSFPPSELGEARGNANRLISIVVTEAHRGALPVACFPRCDTVVVERFGPGNTMLITNSKDKRVRVKLQAAKITHDLKHLAIGCTHNDNRGGGVRARGCHRWQSATGSSHRANAMSVRVVELLGSVFRDLSVKVCVCEQEAPTGFEQESTTDTDTSTDTDTDTDTDTQPHSHTATRHTQKKQKRDF